jgi:ferredoxin--NADP+ reductase
MFPAAPLMVDGIAETGSTRRILRVERAPRSQPEDAVTPAADDAPPRTLSLPDSETVTAVRHWTDRLFSFRVTRPRSLRFRSGEFVMIGLPGDDGRPILRAYSIASPAWDEELEFYSIKVPDGPLTSRLQHIRPGDQIILRPKPVGTLVLDALKPGGRLWFLATGTGIAPFASLMRDPETYERFGQVIMMHTCRETAELDYGRALIDALAEDPLVGEAAAERLLYYPTTTREAGPRMGRITDNLTSGKVLGDLGLAPFDPALDRAMVCGSLAFNVDVKAVLEAFGLREGANSNPQEYVVEKAFVGDGI